MKYINYSVVGQERFRKTKTYIFESNVLEYNVNNNDIINNPKNIRTSTKAKLNRTFDMFEACVIDFENVFRSIPLKIHKITKR